MTSRASEGPLRRCVKLEGRQGGREGKEEGRRSVKLDAREGKIEGIEGGREEGGSEGKE